MHHLLYGPAVRSVCDHWENNSLDYMHLCQQSNISVFQQAVLICHRFPAKKKMSSGFMAAVTICSDFRVQEEEICHYFNFFPSICYEVMGLDAMILILFCFVCLFVFLTI